MSQTENTTVVSVIAEILSLSTPSVQTVENRVSISLPVNETELSAEQGEVLNLLRSEGINLNDIFKTSVSFVEGKLVATIAPRVKAWTREEMETARIARENATATSTVSETETATAETEA